VFLDAKTLRDLSQVCHQLHSVYRIYYIQAAVWDVQHTLLFDQAQHIRHLNILSSPPTTNWIWPPKLHSTTWDGDVPIWPFMQSFPSTLQKFKVFHADRTFFEGLPICTPRTSTFPESVRVIDMLGNTFLAFNMLKFPPLLEELYCEQAVIAYASEPIPSLRMLHLSGNHGPAWINLSHTAPNLSTLVLTTHSNNISFPPNLRCLHIASHYPLEAILPKSLEVLQHAGQFAFKARTVPETLKYLHVRSMILKNFRYISRTTAIKVNSQDKCEVCNRPLQ